MMLLNKKYPTIILVSSFIVLGIFILIFIYYKNIPINNEDLNSLLFTKIKNKFVKSIVSKKSTDYANHGATYVVYGRDSLPTHTGWDEKMEIGDSIIKPKDSLKITIKNSEKIYILDYEGQEAEILTTNF